MKQTSVAIRGRSYSDWHSSFHFQKMEVSGTKASSLTSITKDNMIFELYEKVSDTPAG